MRAQRLKGQMCQFCEIIQKQYLHTWREIRKIYQANGSGKRSTSKRSPTENSTGSISTLKKPTTLMFVFPKIKKSSSYFPIQNINSNLFQTNQYIFPQLIYSQCEKDKQPDQSVESSQTGKRFSFMQKKTSKFLRKATIAAQMESMQENWVENAFLAPVLIVKKRIFSSLHCDKNVKTLPKKALGYLFHQVRMEYVEKNLLKRLSNFEDVSLKPKN